tara:strand:- start:6586 stop:7431 length:846 start_codon:yes stop_codon:yes gene_type:complete
MKQKTKFLACIVYKIILLINYLFFIFFKRQITYDLSNYLQSKVSTIELSQKKELFIYNTSNITNWRINNFFNHEPEILEWIKSFPKKKKIIFWDIGSNIGMYSIYAAKIHRDIDVTAFEPSIKNLLPLLKNVLINNLSSKINIITNPISNSKKKINFIFEKDLVAGSSLNFFDTKKDNLGRFHKNEVKYKLLSINIDQMVKEKILLVPSFIKIDVDGNEHLILKGADKTLNNKKIKEIYIEINDNYKEQKKSVLNILKRKKFKIFKKFKKKNNTYNVIFKR